VTAASWATPDATLVLPADAPREQWLAARRTGLGGSDAASVAGFNKRWSSAREVYLDKLGLLPEKRQTTQMRMGIMLEPTIAQIFTEDTGIAVRRCGLLRSKERPWQMVSVDRLTADGGGLECKNTSVYREEEWGDDDDPLIPDAAELQAWHCMAVTGRSHWWVIGLIGGNNPVIRRVERNQAAIDALTKMEHDFWHAHVLAQVPPPVDGSEGCETLLKRFYSAKAGAELLVDPSVIDPLIIEKEAAAKAVKDAEAALRLVDNQIRDLLGEATELLHPGADKNLMTYRANGPFASKRFRDDNPDLAKQFTRDVTVQALDVDALAAEHPDLHAKYVSRVLRMSTAGNAVLKAAAKAAKETAEAAALAATTTEEGAA
jgi:putative phage-type endonuclease